MLCTRSKDLIPNKRFNESIIWREVCRRLVVVFMMDWDGELGMVVKRWKFWTDGWLENESSLLSHEQVIDKRS